MKHLQNINPYVQASFVAVTATLFTFALGLSMGWLQWDTLNWFEVVAVTTSYACTWLTYQQKRFSYVLGVLTTAVYSIVFFQSGLIASMILNIYLVPTVIFGYFRWRADDNPKPVQKFRVRLLPIYAVVVAVFYGGAVLITHLMGGTMAPLDSFILVGTILAQFLLDNKVLGNWYVWILVNIVSIYVYFSQELYFAGVQYALFLVGAFYGLGKWGQSFVAQGKVDDGSVVAHQIDVGSITARDINIGVIGNGKEG